VCADSFFNGVLVRKSKKSVSNVSCFLRGTATRFRCRQLTHQESATQRESEFSSPPLASNAHRRKLKQNRPLVIHPSIGWVIVDIEIRHVGTMENKER
jgi:hypothetical protein